MAVDPFGLIGQSIDGHYRIDRIIGEGGFSFVYRGTHVGLGEPIAVKCLKLHAALDTQSIESFTRRFRDEGRLQYRLSQGNLDIVRCMASGTTVSTTTGAMVPYMVLEWLEGRSLGADLRDRRKQGLRGRPLEEVLALFEPAVLALDYAHTQGVIHRDVKPGNLFFAATHDGRERMRVLDFGLAKIMNETIGITQVATVGNFMMCSPRYAAPEQFDPKIGAVGSWTDVYSLALVLLEALRDDRVRPSDNMAQCMMEAVDPKKVPSATALGLKLPPRIELALARAVAIDVRTRQQSAGELWNDLRTAMKRRNSPLSVPSVTVALEPPAGPPPSLATESTASRTIADPPPWTAAPGLALGGTLMMPDAPGAQPVPTQPHPQRSPQPMQQPVPAPYVAYPDLPRQSAAPAFAPARMSQPTAPPRRSRAWLVVLVLLLVAAALGAGGFFGWRSARVRRALHLSACAPSTAGAQSTACVPS
ncbi:MAG TPA: protein kinase [Polyangiaceae bacterium]|jgi:serine/threonine-protein kinase